MKTRITRLTVSSPEGFFDVEIADEEGCGEFVLVKLGLSLNSIKEQSISISPNEWPHLREAIDRMFGEIEKEEGGAPLGAETNEPEALINTGCEWDDEDEEDNSELEALLETPAPWEKDSSESYEEYVEPPHDPPDGWIPWEGGDCPVNQDSKVILRYRDMFDTVVTSPGEDFVWKHHGDDTDIIAYRVVSEGPEEEPVDDYGNPLSGDRIIYCCFPDCGCDGARLCQAEKGASSGACAMNIERGSIKDLF